MFKKIIVTYYLIEEQAIAINKQNIGILFCFIGWPVYLNWLLF